MSFSFDRPIGAPADVTELEYVSGLMQTDVEGGIRRDGSIADEDISLFLSSRYGVTQTPDEVQDFILSSLGSTDGYMDMMQLVSLLLIPMLREEQEVREQMMQATSTAENASSRDDLLVYTLEMMLHDVTGSRQPKPLSKTLIKQIFQAYGETALSENEDLVTAMMAQAAGGAAGERVFLDAKTFCRALTSDVQLFNVENKNKLSTSYDDVMKPNDSDLELSSETDPTLEAHLDHHPQYNASGTATPRGDDDSSTVEHKDVRVSDGDDDDVPTVDTAPHIDNTADTFRSRPLVICQWTFFVLSFQTYLISYLNDQVLKVGCNYEEDERWIANAGPFFCTIGINVLKWIIIMLAMSAVGLVYFGIGGIGNNVECTNPWHPLIGVLIAAVVTLLPPILQSLLEPENAENVDVPQEFLQIVTAVSGACAMVIMLWHLFGLLLPKASQLWTWIQCTLVPEAIRTEYNIKQAASYKIGNMVTNALEIHRDKKQETVVPTHFGQALLNFSETRPKYERTGGLRWTCKSIWNRDLFRREGLLLSGRLVSTNFIQFVITVFVLITGIIVTDRVGKNYNKREESVNAFLDTFIRGETLRAELKNAIESGLDVFYPTERYMVVAPLAAGVATAVATGLIISFAVIPSVSSITLKLRSGVMPFVNDPRAKLLRNAPDQTAFLRGVMYWGCFFASILMGAVIAILGFLYVWQVTAAELQAVTASILGALLVIVIHVLINRNIRKVAASAFYRKKPRVANISVLIRECGLVALTQGFVVFRSLRLFLTTILYVGRLDTPFLYDSLGQVGGFRIDREPYMFVIDILQHEAHRHPYIETIGAMYLLKLKHKDNFCSLAGSSWRMIFVYVLMPWLSKYRAFRRPQPELKGDVEVGTGDVTPLPPPLRAVTLVDPQAYALRAVSLVPVASGWADGSSRSVGGGRLSLIREDSNVRDEEIRTLREENRKLKMQLRLQELTPANETLNREARDNKSRPLSASPRPRFEVDSNGRLGGKDRSEPTKARRGVGRHGESENEKQLRPTILKREESEGLSTLRPPAPRRARNDGPQVSWADYGEFDI